MITIRSIYFFLIAILFLLSCNNNPQDKRGLSIDSFERLDVERVFEFSESNEIVFQSISDIKLNSYGHVIVRDFYQHHLSMFDNAGNLIQKIGRQGRGPGEFEYIDSFFAQDSLLIVSDRGSFKVEIFVFQDSIYNYKQGFQLSNIQANKEIIGVVKNNVLMKIGIPVYAGQTNFSPIRNSNLILINNEGTIEDSLLTYPTLESLVAASGEFISSSKTFGNRGYEAYNKNDQIFTAWSDKLEVTSHSLSGENYLAFSHYAEPLEVTDWERDSVLQNMRDPQKSEMQKQFPKVKPLIYSLIVDDEDRIWLELNSKNLENNWFSFSTTGEPLYMIEKPSNSAALEDIKDGNIVWSYTNSDGAPSIALGKLKN